MHDKHISVWFDDDKIKFPKALKTDTKNTFEAKRRKWYLRRAKKHRVPVQIEHLSKVFGKDMYSLNIALENINKTYKLLQLEYKKESFLKKAKIKSLPGFKTGNIIIKIKEQEKNAN